MKKLTENMKNAAIIGALLGLTTNMLAKLLFNLFKGFIKDLDPLFFDAIELISVLLLVLFLFLFLDYETKEKEEVGA